MDLRTYRTAQGLSQSEFARRLTVEGSPATQGLISQWEKGDVTVPAERCAVIEHLTDGHVTRHDLRPDLFGGPPGLDAANEEDPNPSRCPKAA